MTVVAVLVAAALAAAAPGEVAVRLAAGTADTTTLALAAPRPRPTVVELSVTSNAGSRELTTVVLPAGVTRSTLRTPGAPRLEILSARDLAPSGVPPRLDTVSELILTAPSVPICQPSWAVMGGTSQRNGRSTETGPATATMVWGNAAPSQIAWLPMISGHRVFMVGQLAFPPAGEPNGSTIYAHDLRAGSELWRLDVPYRAGDWTTWLAAASQGRLYASRSGNGASVAAPLYALDAATGKTLWTSAHDITTGAYDGVALAPNGDLILGSFDHVIRVRATDGSTVWRTPRQCCVSGECGAVTAGGKAYLADIGAGTGICGGGSRLVAFDLETGARLYASETMPGATLQDMPFVGLDGTVYLPRTQNNPAFDFLYAWTDTGTGFDMKWKQPAAWAFVTVHAVGPDGSIYGLSPGPRLSRLDPADGRERAGLDGDFGQPRMAVDRTGALWVSDGAIPFGHLYALTADLEPRWMLPVYSINIGGPSFGPEGTLVVTASGGTSGTAYRVDPPGAACYFSDDLESGEAAAWSSAVPAD